MTDLDLGNGLHMTQEPSIVEWQHGEVRERIVIPAGEITDYSSVPDRGVLGWLAKRCGFRKDDPRLTRAGKIHDPLYFALKHWHGILPDGWFQVYSPNAEAWINVVAYQWSRQQADAIWRRVAIEDGFPPKLAGLGYWTLRTFGGLHMALTR